MDTSPSDCLPGLGGSEGQDTTPWSSSLCREEGLRCFPDLGWWSPCLFSSLPWHLACLPQPHLLSKSTCPWEVNNRLQEPIRQEIPELKFFFSF